MKRRLCGATIGVFLTLAPLRAQNQLNFAWWSTPIVRDLNLSENQLKQIHDVVRSYRSQLIDARGAVQKAEGDLTDLLNGQQYTMAEAKPIIERLAEARASSTRISTEMGLRLRLVLTMEQWRELVKRWGELQRNKRPSDTQVAP